MIDLCQISFDKGLRNSNPVITAMCQVACPSELVAATGIHRSDEKNSMYVCNKNYETAGGVITKMMDCGTCCHSIFFLFVSELFYYVVHYITFQQSHRMAGRTMSMDVHTRVILLSSLADEMDTRELIRCLRPAPFDPPLCHRFEAV